MALRRGPSNAERLAVDLITITASGQEALKTNPCFLYKVIYTENEGLKATIRARVADATASGTKEKFSVSIASGAGSEATKVLDFNPPVFMQAGIFVSSTGGTDLFTLTFQYLDAQ